MARLDISTPIFSLSAPSLEIFKDSQTQQTLARKVNEYGASLRDSNPPGTFGYFATVPSLLDTEGAIEEIKYALDVLKADGVVLFTRYGNGNYYLGHPSFIPIWNVLNERKATIFVHPAHPTDHSLVNKYMPAFVLDFPAETTKTAVDLILSRRMRETCFDCKIVLSHAGGTLPFVIDRVAKLEVALPLDGTVPDEDPQKRAELNAGMSEAEIREDAKKFYVDTALSSSASVIGVCREFFGDEHIVFGSDFPYASKEVAIQFTEQLEGVFSTMDKETKDKIVYKNALKLVPRLRELMQ
jgi:6-methylsalicylate decarboxylase